MSPTTIHLILILSLFIHPHPTAADQSFISVLITQNGLDFFKNFLVSKEISILTPLRLSKLEKVVKIPVIGKVYIVLSDITINWVIVGSSSVIPGATGVSIAGSDVTCDLNMKWHYSYGTWLVPISVQDSGTASIKVNGVETNLMVGLDIQKGSLKPSVKECNCRIRDISIDLDGGASWLYQGIVDAFEDEIVTAVQKAIIKKLNSGVSELGSMLQSFPKQVSVDDTASLNVTLVNEPFLSNTSLGFEINGLFVGSKTDMLPLHNTLQPSVSCSDPAKMIELVLDEAVFNSMFALYYNASFMRWIVDKIPQQSLLNTAGWRYIVPQLYKQYPNADMNLNISLSSPPVVQISGPDIGATIYVDLVIDVLKGNESIPIACITLENVGTGSVQMNGNHLTGHLRLDHFTMTLKWSKIGNLHMFLIQPVMWTIIETVFLPYANAQLAVGFPLPIVQGFTLQNAEIISSGSRIAVCSDISYQESFDATRHSLNDTS